MPEGNERVPVQEFSGEKTSSTNIQQWIDQHVYPIDLRRYERNTAQLSCTTPAPVEGFFMDDSHPIRQHEGDTGVYHAVKEGTEKKYIIKIIDTEDMYGRVNDLPEGISSVESHLVQQNMPVDSVVSLPIAIKEQDGKLIRVYEAGTADMEQYLESGRVFSPEETISIMLQVCRGMKELHERKVVHGDIAESNIVLNPDGRMQLIDVEEGSLEQKDGQYQRPIVRAHNIPWGNRYICPPEIYEETEPGMNTFDKTLDIYESAAMCYKMMTGHAAYVLDEYEGRESKVVRPGDTGFDAFFTERAQAYKKLHEQGDIHFPDSIPAPLRVVIKKAMSPEPAMRYQTADAFAEALMDAYDALS